MKFSKKVRQSTFSHQLNRLTKKSVADLDSIANAMFHGVQSILDTLIAMPVAATCETNLISACI
jgi:hypothetical protein